jgi:segregation and condensation protein A
LIRPREDLVTPAGSRPEGDQAAAWDPDRLPPELEFFRDSVAYQVQLESFEGPLDLLLYLIQKDQLDIYDIPIASITDQYLQYLEVIQMLSLDTAGDFLVMAATLLRIKARLLLPVQAEEELDEEDPRADLVRRLLEYKRYKEAAARLREHEDARRHYHLRQSRYPFLAQLELEPPLRLELFDLLSALASVFDRIQASPVHAVRREPYTVEQKIALIRDRLGAVDSVRFDELFAEDAIKMEVIVTFIAILELVKRGELRFFQTEPQGAIWLRPGDHPPAAETPASSALVAAEAQG